MRITSALFLLLALAGCDTTLEAAADVVVNPDQGVDIGGGVDQLVPDQLPPTGLEVAAIQYYPMQHAQVDDCGTSMCAIRHLVQEAAKEGARLVLLPDHVLGGVGSVDTMPLVGDKPATDSKYRQGSPVKAMALLADDEEVTLVFNVNAGDQPAIKYHTSLAIDCSGKVIARHFKFQLLSLGELGNLTAGTSVAESCFDTLAGKACMLAGMDAGCIVKDNKVGGTDCTQHGVDMLKDFAAHKPDIVLFATAWEATGANPVWQIPIVMKKIATHFGAWVVGANITLSPGQGGGIWKPDGTPVDTYSGTTPKVVYGTIPYKTP